ncbi:MAG: transcriptional regulator [Candidatus Micrarchaeia archaeon]
MATVYETAQKEIIPAVRLYIAKTLNEQYKMKQENIAGILGVAQAAVSKYLAGKYSEKIKKTENMLSKDILNRYLPKIAEGKREYVNVCICEMCQLLNSFKCSLNSTA